ncbi:MULTISPECIES: phosphatase PAP2 family protein [unclassified Paenibacillus]|uniref:phosphatase PAP2 family protein n=1 Tax=unclassified Paenibacillus TaxID=185978 RepID=UPI001C0F606E|nr:MULTISPECIES: phosphatase PAP2 family protein [unclassified Paenibacillus]MBU5443850.1 phosphatase PAP2 family protein [Paenibacillus sp. MSJ-34]CAH0121488.1 hypothetical protein PAE9249_04018 [Paenibacillus sp. CECT 9249]
MNRKKSTYYSLFAALFAAACFTVFAFIIFSGRIEPFDSGIIAFVQGFESDSFTAVSKLLSALGGTKGTIAVTIVAAVFLFAVLKHRKELLFLFVAVGGAATLNFVMKNGFQRERPDLHRLIEETGFSFPSGHSMAAFALYCALAYLLWRHIRSAGGRGLLIVCAVALIAFIGISRIYLGVHYPSDIIGGYLASGCWMLIVIWCFRRMFVRSEF